MKVLHLINTLSAGGAELHLLTLCRYLKRHRVQVAVACLREQVKGSRSLHSDFEKEGIKVINLQADSRYNWRFLLRFAHLLKVERPDILHTHLPRADLAGAFAQLFSPNIYWVCSIHDIYSESWFGRWALPLFNLLWCRADAVIAISHTVKSWLVEKRRIDPGKIPVIHYGIETTRFTQAHSDLRRTSGVDGQMIIGSIGRLEPRKGHENLIHAMPGILQQLPQTSLLIAGHDPWGYAQTLQALIVELGLKDHIRLVGFQDDVPSFLSGLDVFAFASRSEGFGQVVIEAMAAERPVVASRIPPLTEIIIDGETGLLADADNPQAFAHAISWLLMHPEEARRMSKRGQERVYSHFSAERMSAEILSQYSQLIGEQHVEGSLVRNLHGSMDCNG